MVRGIAAILIVSSLCTLTACSRAKRSTPSTSAATAGGEAAGTAASSRHKRNEKRELTWDEYYVEVEQRTRHAGGMVMWFNPPRLVRRPCPEPSDPTPQPAGASVSDPVH